MKRLLVVFLTLAVVLTGFVGNVAAVKAATEPIYITDNKDLIVTPGQTTHISLPVQAKSSGLYINDISVTASKEDNDLFDFTKPELTYKGSKQPIMLYESPVDLGFDVTVDDSAIIKSYPITITINYTDLNNQGTTADPIILTSYLKVQSEKAPAQMTVSNVSLDSTVAGSSSNLNFTVMNEGEITAKSVTMTLDLGTVMDGDYRVKNIKLGDMKPGDIQNISLPVTILTTASAGKNLLIANFSYKNVVGASQNTSYKFYVNLISNSSGPNLIVTNMTYGGSLKPGDDFNLTVDIKNTGLTTASNIVAKVNASSITQDGIIKDYYTTGIKASNLSKAKSSTIKIPLTVSKYATGGMKSVIVDITYTDSTGTKYTVSETAYVDVAAATTAGAPNIVISNVAQSPSQPQAGDNMTVSFTVENKSKVDATELKIYPDGLTGNTFIPLNSDPYTYIEKLAGGQKKKITIPLSISTDIPEGLNNLTIKYSYTGNEGASVVIPIHDIQNSIGSSSIPKLIVSKYTTDVDQLKAGSIFKLSYDIYNTNASVAAKNITVTLTQADNIFTVNQGSNSFFINKMKPGESVTNEVEMKVKSDATTKAYPITLTIEYEYDGEEPNKETGEVGLKRTETLNLNAEENARPVADSIQVSSWEGGVTVGNAATLSFNFYNMGKAVLNNVMATVEGDGFTATGGMLFIGNVEPGSSAYEEIEVIPNSEGSVSGTLKLSYENSNGETVEFIKEFQADVMPAAIVDPGMPGDAGEVINPDATVAKKAILPIWAFILILIAVFAIFVPVTRKIVLSVYKAKMRRKEQEQYDKEQA
jgi:hypothetical protein